MTKKKVVNVGKRKQKKLKKELWRNEQFRGLAQDKGIKCIIRAMVNANHSVKSIVRNVFR
ncbi:hypothetical protein WCSV-1gp9 [Water chestnut soymovirus 1]|uniref:Uncharacterized protein n=1 Tax=Water chestnut soymovirus 1 TaxID=1848040 RepID=A0A172PC90_9VIRU|nr:hypothetical protein WCSV-1gp9 [Water chestnut soymovirus 1]AND65756.1 hypothetical protein WCSV-1gp9 [Water chestnut soymovirus 1]